MTHDRAHRLVVYNLGTVTYHTDGVTICDGPTQQRLSEGLGDSERCYSTDGTDWLIHGLAVIDEHHQVLSH